MATPEQTTKTANVGMIGLAVMGENLAMNIERNGYPIAVFNRDPAKVDDFVARAKGKQVIGTHTPEEFVKALERPRKAILLVKAGDPVDWTINQIKPYLEKGDIIIEFDGRPIRTAGDLRYRAGAAVPLSTVQIVVVRAGQMMTIPVKLGSQR